MNPTLDRLIHLVATIEKIMNRKLIALVLLVAVTSTLMAADTAFTYHGKLTDNGTPPTAAYDFKFTLRERAPGVQSWGPLTKANVNVVAGEFDVMLDFGTDPFRGNDVQLEIAARVHPASGDPPYATLSPAVTLTAVPYAIAALNTAPNSITAQHIAPNQVVKSINGIAADAITIQAGNGVTIAPPTPQGAIVISAQGNGWALTGNSGTTPNQFIGTTDDRELTFRVNGQQAMRYQPGPTSPSIVGGYSQNSITANTRGAVIAGGGGDLIRPNRITADFAVIGGGSVNTVSAAHGAVAGGFGNSVKDGSDAGTISGGDSNTIGTDDPSTNPYAAVIGGGSGNAVGPNADYAVIPGGRGALARSPGQLVHANGSFRTPGDAQTSTYVFRAITTVDAISAWTPLDAIVTPENSAVSFRLQVSAISTGSPEFASFGFSGVFAKFQGEPAVVRVQRDSWFSSDGAAGWQVLVGNGPIGGERHLTVVFNGSVRGSIKWVATLWTTEVIR